jgi:phage terminase large subunit-like protein
MADPHPLVRITLSVDGPDPRGITLDLDVGDPVYGVDGGDVLLTLAAISTHIAAACDAAWARMAEAN